MRDNKFINIHADIFPFIIKNGIGWGIIQNNNILYKFDSENWTVEAVDNLSYGFEGGRSHYLVECASDKLAAIPNRGKDLCVINLDNCSINRIPISQKASDHLIYSYYTNEGILYLYLGDKENVLKINLHNYTVEEINEGKNIGRICYYADADTEIIRSIEASSNLTLCEFNIKTGYSSKYEICENQEKYEYMYFDGKNYWFCGKTKNMLIWNKEIGIVKKLSLSGYNICEYDFNSLSGKVEIIREENRFPYAIFSHMLPYNNKMWLFPYESNLILYIDVETFEISSVKLPDEEESVDSLMLRKGLDRYKYSFEYISDEKEIVVYSFKNKVHYFIDSITGEIVRKRGAMKLVNPQKYCELLINNNQILQEDEYTNLNDLLMLVR